jgi:hypothetical protein
VVKGNVNSGRLGQFIIGYLADTFRTYGLNFQIGAGKFKAGYNGIGCNAVPPCCIGFDVFYHFGRQVAVSVTDYRNLLFNGYILLYPDGIGDGFRVVMRFRFGCA